ncbi:MAG: methylmalonyl-CoA mutase family protein [Cyclobacteriaceae bacterium]
MKEIDLTGFSKITKEEWLRQAEKQLGDKEALNALSWLSDQSIPVDPYYDNSDLRGLEYLDAFFKTLKPFRWKLYEEIKVDDERSANQIALEALAGGCDGLIFTLIRETNPDVLMEEILTEICDISFQTSGDLDDNFRSIANTFYLSNSFRNVISVEGSTKNQADQIVEIIRERKNESYIIRESDPDFFLEIAAIRALRYLLSEKTNDDPWSIHIHTTVPFHKEEDHQWFLNTTSGLASILGGTNSIRFSTASGSPRISRNVGNLIREESGIEEYTDQCRGAYYVEVLTHKIIESCTKKLTS